VSTPTFPKRDPAGAEFWDLRYQARFAPWDAGRVPVQLQDFVATDSRPEALGAARAILGEHVNRVRYGDFFAPVAEAPFEVAYERAFLCALPRRMWRDWGRRMAEVVEPGGRLAGFFFFDAGDRGPPFPLNAPYELSELLEPAFERIADEPVPDSIDVFKGKERWQVWLRR
jgi:hypothetical protein